MKEKNPKDNLIYLFFGALIILSVCMFMVFLGLTAPEQCSWLLLVPGYETRTVEMYSGEGGYKIAKGSDALIIWKYGNSASARIDGNTYHGIIALSDNFCTLSLQLTEQIFVDQPWWLTEDA